MAGTAVEEEAFRHRGCCSEPARRDCRDGVARGQSRDVAAGSVGRGGRAVVGLRDGRHDRRRVLRAVWSRTGSCGGRTGRPSAPWRLRVGRLAVRSPCRSRRMRASLPVRRCCPGRIPGPHAWEPGAGLRVPSHWFRRSLCRSGASHLRPERRASASHTGLPRSTRPLPARVPPGWGRGSGTRRIGRPQASWAGRQGAGRSPNRQGFGLSSARAWPRAWPKGGRKTT